MIWVGVLISFAVFLQSLEMLRLKPYPWPIVKSEMPWLLRPLLRPYPVLPWLRLGAAMIAPLFPHWSVVLVLFLTSWLIAVRWRGTFNGGSDSMTIHILAAWFVYLSEPDNAWVERGCLYYVALQLTLSYFTAGVAKLRNPEWRNGQALTRFVPLKAGAVSALLLIGFECLFPLALLGPWVCAGFVAAGIVFHLLNSYYLGLNRFFFVWLAAYPALFLTSVML